MKNISTKKFTKNILRFDTETETAKIVDQLKIHVFDQLRKRGSVVGVSGGVDSAVVLALAVRAFGIDKVTPVLLPEKDSSPDSMRLALELCEMFGVHPVIEDITEALLGFGAYLRRDRIVRQIFPDYNESLDQIKLTIPGDLMDNRSISYYELTVIKGDQKVQSARLDLDQLREIIAATNFKQRTRAALLYYHAEIRNYAVIGTSQRNEHDLGFFVKYGDSAVDVRPLAHLYKTQVYYLAEYLGVPSSIRERAPTSDTYSAETNQTEFFFRVPFEKLDLIWFAMENNIPLMEVADELQMSIEQVENVMSDIRQKQRSTYYLRQQPLRIQEDTQAKGA